MFNYIRSHFLSLSLFIPLLTFNACIRSNATATSGIQTKSTITANTIFAQSIQNKSRQVQVFLPKKPQSYQNFSYVEPVTRTTDQIGIAEFAIAQLVAGPTQAEQQRGFIDPIDFSGDSTCGGEDFNISISKGVATLQFCRTVPTQGVGDDARIQSAVRETLTQFNTIDSVVILDKNGTCFADLSGKNQCLEKNKHQVQVFFPKQPKSNQDFNYVEPVTRTTNSLGLAEFAISQLIAGPTQAEKQKGFIDPIEFSGDSTCGGEDFNISISKGVATLQFCRTVPTQGVGDDARIQSAVRETLTQFDTVDSVVILNKDKNCFKDLSGKNACLQSKK